MKKYLVIAKKWDSDAEHQIEVVVGEFDRFVMEDIFKKAYNEHYKSNAFIAETSRV